jgi:DNA modification methylase
MKVIHGDNIELLKQYPDNYFDAIVTDAPYGLGKEPNATELMKDWIEKGYHEVGGSGFMGKQWDAFVPQPLFWKECFRVLKHGGHVLSFFGTRTYDWGVMAMRFAGFEVRDCIQWVYGSGFPKSHNISKAIDKMYGAEREVVGEKVRGDVQKAKENGSGYLSDPANRNNEKQFGYGTELITKASTEQAKEWEGYGSALKPANEPIVLARKPLEKGLSIAENVLKWGVGAINIDGCRVGSEMMGGGTMPDFRDVGKKSKNVIGIDKLSFGQVSNVDRKEYNNLQQGRFPANLILTHHPECECLGTKKVKSQNGGNSRAIQKNTYNDFGKNYDNTPNGEKCGFADENGEETIEDWNCVEGGFLISPCIYLDGYEITKFNYQSFFDVIQRHRDICHILEYPYNHNKDKHNFLDYETFHDLGWTQLPSFRVYYPFLCRFYDALVQTFQVYDQLSVRQLNDALYVATHFLELLHNHIHLNHDHLSKQNDSDLYSLSQHILENKEFFVVFLNKIFYHNVDILFQELAKTDFRDNILENKIFEDFLFYLSKMELNNSCILHLHQMLFCLSLQINFNEQIYYKEFELPNCPIKILDEQSGITKSAPQKRTPRGVYQGNSLLESKTMNLAGLKEGGGNFSDKGGASRFFYIAKASKSERNKGLEGFEEKPLAFSNQAKAELKRGNDNFDGGDAKGHGNSIRHLKNFHPTVKPIKLMQYLVRLITPPNGIVLDPFCGSGTTGIACKLEGFEFVGLEQDAEYCKIAQARIDNYVEDKKESKKSIKPKEDNNFKQPTLF